MQKSPRCISASETNHPDELAFGPRRRILIADESRLMRSVFSKTLSPYYECVAVRSCDEAIAQMELCDFDVVLADVAMPGRSGIDLLTEITECFSQTEVIMTSSDRPEGALEAKRLGAFDYLIKPCELSILEQTVGRALKRKRTGPGARRASTGS